MGSAFSLHRPGLTPPYGLRRAKVAAKVLPIHLIQTNAIPILHVTYLALFVFPHLGILICIYYTG